MDNVKSFLDIKREGTKYRPVGERIKDYCEVAVMRPAKDTAGQASRCMDCGTPFCHWGCPVDNYIPEWNKAMEQGHWKKAFELLSATNDFPEITGRVCPAICEYSCVLGFNDEAVTIRENELAVIEYAFNAGLVKALPPKRRSGKSVAVIGSGPAGLACAVNLNRRGHNVVVFEKNSKPGGILRYGIPDFKLNKRILDRRINLLKEEGVVFKTGIYAGIDYPVEKLLSEFDAVCLATGSGVPRDVCVDGRGLKGIHFAMDYLTQSNKRVAGEKIAKDVLIEAKGKKVVVIGGGDTGSDCIGTANRQGAIEVTQIEILPKPPECRTAAQPWPCYPSILKTSSSHEEGARRIWSVQTKGFVGCNGVVKKIRCVKVGEPEDEFEITADLVLIAAGFLHPEKRGLVESLKLKLDDRGNVCTNGSYTTSRKGVFSAGDMRRGQSLVVWAISEGKNAAISIDKFLRDRKSV